MKNRDSFGQFSKKHEDGLYRSATYLSWSSMKQRCNDLTSKHYGARGISYPAKWEEFSGFVEDMGLRPEGTTLDRIETDKSYSKDNCRWASRTQQNENKRAYGKSGIKNIHQTKTKAGSDSFLVKVKNHKPVRVSTIEKAIALKTKLEGKL